MFEPLKPPRVPLVILNFFASQPDFPAVLGDISEEFHQRIQSYGTRAAHRWFWQEAIRNALALSWRELRRTPVRTTLTALACGVGASIGGIPPWKWNSSIAEQIAYVLQSLLFLAAGLIAARRLRGREWALALTFGLFWASQLYSVYKTGMRYHAMSEISPLLRSMILDLGLFWLGCLTIRLSASFHRRVETAD